MRKKLYRLLISLFLILASIWMLKKTTFAQSSVVRYDIPGEVWTTIGNDQTGEDNQFSSTTDDNEYTIGKLVIEGNIVKHETIEDGTELYLVDGGEVTIKYIITNEEPVRNSDPFE